MQKERMKPSEYVSESFEKVNAIDLPHARKFLCILYLQVDASGSILI